MSITSRTNLRRNALRISDPLGIFLAIPDRMISRPDRTSIGGGWRPFVETGAISGQLQATPSIGGKTLAKPSIDGGLTSRP